MKAAINLVSTIIYFGKHQEVETASWFENFPILRNLNLSEYVGKIKRDKIISSKYAA